MKKTYLLLALFSYVVYAKFITIGTGSVTGTYYVTGEHICKLVNKVKNKTNTRCSVESTGGSINNINSLKNGELDFAIVQNDVAYHSSKATNGFEHNKISNVKSVLAIYPELFTLVTRKDANINSYEDLKNKRINLGNKGSGNESTALTMFKAVGLKIDDLKFASSLTAHEMPDALRDNMIDGYFYMVGHPTFNITDASNITDVKITPLSGVKIDKLINDNPYFSKEFIKGGLYKNNDKDIATFGVKAVLVVNDNISKEVVYNLVKVIFENFNDFKKQHNAYSNITKESLVKGLSIEMHEGSRKYFKEVGLLK